MGEFLGNKKKVILVDIADKRQSEEDKIARAEELESLVKTYGNVEVVELISKFADPDLKLFIKKGLLDELIEKCRVEKITHIILGNILKPRQIYELSEIFRKEKVEVFDRVDLILKIFSLHAQSAEAKLQIELAKIRHMGPRIFGMGDELSRQGGGIGTRGQGETNTEVMKRHLSREQKKIEERLEKIGKTKELHRSRRRKNNFKTVALVGYTNAGKSSLMNTLSKKGVAAENALFKTLDTRIGKMWLPDLQEEICISDTIGFITDLPPKLISAFSSTLSEAIEADILLHVVDVSDPRVKEKIQVVDDILKELGADDKKQILVFNKLDQVQRGFGRSTLRRKYANRSPVFLSAHTKEGMDSLQWRLENIWEK